MLLVLIQGKKLQINCCTDERLFWIDQQTRAVFTEANVFNANANVMLLITFLHEIIPIGCPNFHPNV